MAKYRKIWYRDNKGEVRCVEPPASKVKDEGEVIKIEWEDSIQEIPKDRIVEDVQYYDDCFISTAVYGTRSAEQLNVLRGFRDDVMKTNFIGKLLLEYYYRISPNIANEIADNENIKRKLQRMLNFSVSMIEKRENSVEILKAFYGVAAIISYLIICLIAKILTKRYHGKEKNIRI